MRRKSGLLFLSRRGEKEAGVRVLLAVMECRRDVKYRLSVAPGRVRDHLVCSLLQADRPALRDEDLDIAGRKGGRGTPHHDVRVSRPASGQALGKRSDLGPGSISRCGEVPVPLSEGDRHLCLCGCPRNGAVPSRKPDTRSPRSSANVLGGRRNCRRLLELRSGRGGLRRTGRAAGAMLHQGFGPEFQQQGQRTGHSSQCRRRLVAEDLVELFDMLGFRDPAAVEVVRERCRSEIHVLRDLCLRPVADLA